jgi:hypothetical protein
VFNAAKMVLVVVAMFMLARLGSKLARYFFARATSLDSAQQVLGEKIVSLMVWALAFFMGIDLLGINFTALTVFSGAFGLAIGFGLQKTFGNLIAGLILLMDRSIKPGDVIAIGEGTVGQVRKIGIRAVSVATRDHREYLIPNEILMTTQVENWSYSNTQIVLTIPVSVAYGTDIDQAERLMLRRRAPRRACWPSPALGGNDRSGRQAASRWRSMSPSKTRRTAPPTYAARCCARCGACSRNTAWKCPSAAGRAPARHRRAARLKLRASEPDAATRAVTAARRRGHLGRAIRCER